MKVFIDTSNKDLFLSLVQNGKTINFILIKDLIKKADALPQEFSKLLDSNFKTNEITDFYITLGPGSFTGARTALVFARSICQMTKANLLTTTSIQLIAGPQDNHDVYIDARSNKSYYGQVTNGKLVEDIKLVDFQESTNQSYDDLIANPASFESLYKKEEEILAVHPLYIKEAKIGGDN